MARLLIVEDELLVAQSMATLLELNGHEVVGCVATAEEAVAAAVGLAPQLVLMDVHLRGSPDGIEAARAIRGQVDVPIVFLTAYGDRAHLERAKLTAPHAYLLKPYSDQELLTTIELVVHRHRLEAELRERERWLGTTLRSIGDGVIGVGRDGRVQFVNRAAEQLTGWSHGEAVGRPLAEVLPLVAEVSRLPLVLPLAEAMVDGSSRGASAASLLVARDGRERAIEESVAAIVDDRGHVFGGVVIFRDVTARRDVEARLALADRMASLATLTAGLGHELNNPLSYNLSNLELVLDASLPSLRRQLAGLEGAAGVSDALVEIEAALADARAGAERMREILGAIRAFGRGAGESDLPVDVAGTVEDAIRLAANELAQRTTVVTELRARPTVNGHAGQLCQVFTNLLVNAAQAIPAGASSPAPIRVVVDQTEDDAIVEVIDPGTGIAPELMLRVFEPFFTTRPIGLGLGLGLSIVHTLVERHRGRVTVASKLGEGSTFRVTLPRIAARPRPPTPVATTTAPVRRRILVVDDDERVGRALRAMLRGHHDVTVLTSPKEALARLASEDFDAIVIDLMMPELTGMELHAALRESRPELAERALFVTGGAFTPETQAFVAAMAERVLLKPVSAGVLRAAIDRVSRPR